MKKDILEMLNDSHKNMIVGGDVGVGKTTSVLFPVVENAINSNESLFILDSREEYLNKYYEILKNNNYNIIILNLRDLDKSEGWNPLEYPYNLYKNGNSDRAQEYVEKIGKTIFYENTTSDPFWYLTSADLFTGITLGLFEDGKADEINFNSIGNMLNGFNNRYATSDYTTEYFKLKDTSSSPYVFASTTVLAPNETKGSILSLTNQKIRLYLTREKLSQFMNKTTFDFSDLIHKTTAIFMIGRDENKATNTLCSIFIEQLYSILVDFKNTNKFNLVLDNFDIIEKCNDLVEILGSCTSRNIKTYIAIRSIKELENIYGSYMLKLCDICLIENEEIQISTNNSVKRIKKDIEHVGIPNTIIEYPKLIENEIKVFNIEGFVTKQKREKLFASIDENTLNYNQNFVNNLDPKNDDINAIIKRIDDKIAELEQEENRNNLNNDSIISELQQFKIDE